MEKDFRYLEIGKYFLNGRSSEITELAYSDRAILEHNWYREYGKLADSLAAAGFPNQLFALLPSLADRVDEFVFLQAEKKHDMQTGRPYYQARFTLLRGETIRNAYRNGIQLFTALATHHGNETSNSPYSLKTYHKRELILPPELSSLNDISKIKEICLETPIVIGAILSGGADYGSDHTLFTCTDTLNPILKLHIIEQSLSFLWYRGVFSFSTDYLQGYTIAIRFLSQDRHGDRIHSRQFEVKENGEFNLNISEGILRIIQSEKSRSFRADEEGIVEHITFLIGLMEQYGSVFHGLMKRYSIGDLDEFGIADYVERLKRIETLVVASRTTKGSFLEIDSLIQRVLDELSNSRLRVFFEELGAQHQRFLQAINSEISHIEDSMMNSLVANNFMALSAFAHRRGELPAKASAMLARIVDGISGYIEHHTPIPITRYGNISYPRSVYKDREFGITMELGIAPSSEQSPRITIPQGTRVGKLSVDVLISFEAQDFENTGDFFRKIPIDPESSTIPVLFTLRALSEGKKTVKLDFFHQSNYQGRAVATIDVIDSPLTATTERLIDSFMHNSGISINTFDTTTTTSPDLTVFLHKVDDHYQYRLCSNRPGLAVDLKDAAGQINVAMLNPQSYMQRIYEEINEKIDMQVDSKLFHEDINSIGTQLYDRLFPPELKTIWWEKIHDKVTSILIVSDETWIPWELIKPYQRLENGKIQEDDFLCEKYQLSRWLQGSASLPHKIEFKELKLIISSAMKDLEGEIEELGAFKSDWLRVEKIPASLDKVFSLLSTGGFSALHFGCHSFYDKDNPDYSYLELDDDEKLQPRHISGSKESFGADHPLVFLNACASGRSAASLTGVGGWVGQFLAIGASAFIGAIWDIDNSSATPFARYFYEYLLDGKTIGEAAQAARLKIKKAGDPSWLSYIVYANPNSMTMTAKKSMQIEQAKEVIETLQGVMQ